MLSPSTSSAEHCRPPLRRVHAARRDEAQGGLPSDPADFQRSIGRLATRSRRSAGAAAAAPAPLRLTIAWADSLEAWQVDVVHPVTGEVLSTASPCAKVMSTPRTTR